jgi:predicted deacetylase
MSARYLVRLDDACDTMDCNKWDLVERVLDAHGVKPIVAVVPDNRDPQLVFQSADRGFWEKVRSWQAKGWAVAMHGHTHVMRPTREPQLVPLYPRSEFAGLALAEQAAKIRESWRQFAVQSVTPQVWVAPAHSFDAVTLDAIRAETPIRVVSDGIGWSTWYEHGFHWVPQQLWGGFARRPFGLWTVCLHPNGMDAKAVAALDGALGGPYRGSIISFADVHLNGAARSAIERLYDRYFWWRWRRIAPRTEAACAH